MKQLFRLVKTLFYGAVVSMAVVTMAVFVYVKLTEKPQTSGPYRPRQTPTEALATYNLGQRHAEIQSMERVMRLIKTESDKYYAFESSSAKEFMTLLQSVVTNMRAINLEDCPNKFKAAFVKHVDTWEEMLSLAGQIDKYIEESGSFGTLLTSFVEGMVGSHTTYNKVSSEQQRLKIKAEEWERKIKETYNDMKYIAIEAGCNLL